jgi:hypothetical protein
MIPRGLDAVMLSVAGVPAYDPGELGALRHARRSGEITATDAASS